MIALLICRLVAAALVCWYCIRLHRKVKALTRSKELWKTLAIATEVQLECLQDYHTEKPGEGCMTRHRRRETDIEQSNNAETLALDTKQSLIDSGEYEG